MYLVTGGTGFIGRALLRHLFEAGLLVRVLLHPAPRTPRLPKGIPLDVAVASLSDPRGLRAAMTGVKYVIHLASAENQGPHADLLRTDVLGTKNLAEAAADARVKRLIYLSHLDADRMSAFPVLRAKGIAEEHIRRSGVPFTILRSAVVFGPEDHFTVTLARLLRYAPLFPLPGGGRTVVQPLWIEDVITCLLWALDREDMVNQTYEIGGSEYFTLREVVEIIMGVTQYRRKVISLSVPMVRALIVTLQTMVREFPISSFHLDYVSLSRTCPVDSVPRLFGLMPARFAYRLEYLRRYSWRQRLERWWAVHRQRLADRLRGEGV